MSEENKNDCRYATQAESSEAGRDSEGRRQAPSQEHGEPSTRPAQTAQKAGQDEQSAAELADPPDSRCGTGEGRALASPRRRKRGAVTGPTYIARVKDAVRERDGHRCVECGMTHKQHVARYGKTLDVHREVPGSIYTIEGCVTLCRRCHGPKPKQARGTGEFVTIRLPTDIVRKIRILAAFHRVRPRTYLEATLGPIVMRDFNGMFSSPTDPE